MGVVRGALRLAFIVAGFGLGGGCGGGASSVSNPGPIPNPIPTLTAIMPTSAVAGSSALMLTAMGTGFVSGSEIEWNGVALSTIFVSSTQLQATVPTSNLSNSGSPSVTVVNPAPGGGSSTGIAFTVSAPQNPVPTISQLSPPESAVGAIGFTLTVSGTGFVSGAQILWNGSARSTTFLSGTSLSAQINASDVAAAGTATVTVNNPSPGGGGSNVLNFTVATITSNLTVLDVEGNDLAWVPQQKLLYISVPAAATSLGTTITAVDPIAGKVVSSAPLSSEAGRISVSDDGQYLYTILGNENAVARYTLPGVTADIKWTLGSDPIFGTIYPFDVKAQPAGAHTVAVITETTASPPAAFGNGVAIYDDGKMRATALEDAGVTFGSVDWKSDGSELFIEDNLSSDRALYELAVSSGGVTLGSTFGAAFRAWGVHLHSDPQTAYLYSDQGEIVNSANGLPIGNFPMQRASGNPTLLALDPGLKRAFVLTPTTDSAGNAAFLLRVYDQTNLSLIGSFLIPGGVGTPADFVRWGTSGLAFVTNGVKSGTPAVGKLYILDGLIVNPAGPADSATGTPLNPLPTLELLEPVSTSVGSGGVTVTLTGLDFVSQPAVQWNGTTIPSTWVSNTEMQATVPASSLVTSGQALLTVANAGPGGGTSTALPFSVNPVVSAGNRMDVYGVGGNDLAWDSQRQRLYVSTPGIQGELGDKIVVVDPVTATVEASAFIGSEPAELSISSDSQYLYVGMNGQNSVERFILPGLTPDISFPLGSDSFDGPFYALDLKSAPAMPNTAAVSTGEFDVSPASTGITIFDDATARPTRAPGWNTSAYSYASVDWGSDATTMYAAAQEVPTDMYVLSVNGTGIQVSKDFPDALQFPNSDFAVHFDSGTGFLYTDGGEVVRPSDATIVGTFGASGMLVPDSSLNRVFILGQTVAQTGSTNFTIESFDQTSFAAVDSITVANVVGTPSGFVRWGTNGLAFVTRVGGITDQLNTGPGQLYVISGVFVNSSAPASSVARTPLVSHVRKTWNSRQTEAKRRSRRPASSTP